MSLNTILTVKNEDLQRLAPEGAVDLFRDLLWAEATSLGIAKDLINVPSQIDVADGGIDAEVRDVQTAGGQGIIKQGLTRYQIKTGRFNLGEERYVKEILFKKGSNELKPRVKSCFERGGTLVVVLFGWDGAEPREDAILEKFRAQLADVDPRYAEAQIEIWQQNQLIGFLRPFPGLALRANGRYRGRFETHWDWAAHSDMTGAFIPGEPQEEFVSRLQAALRETEGPVHVRVWGEAGVGKTRLVLEATDTDDLGSLVVYCSAHAFRDSALMHEMLRGDFRAVLVLDECDPATRASVWNLLECHSPEIKLVSIYNEKDDSSRITCLYAPPLGERQIAEIIQEYGVPPDRASTWARECSGSPRVAHVVGWNLVNHPEDILKPPSTVNIWERYIVGLDDPGTREVQERRTVLGHIALFKRFGYGGPVVAEGKAVAKLVEQADPQITWSRFQEIVKRLRDRKILQGDNTLYITPKLLHIKLWIDWWDTHGVGFSPDNLASLPPALLTWFTEMFEYAAGSRVAFRTARALLDKGGRFQHDPGFLSTGPGARFFQFLARANPEGALDCLQNTIGTWDREQLLQFTTGRREVVWALEETAKWEELFEGSANLLLSLGEAENETWTNNASGVFVDLFSMTEHRALSRTGASPQERFSVLKAAVESPSKERRQLGLRACDRALQRISLGPVVGSPRIVGQEPELWAPQTWGDLFDAYRQVWQYLLGKLDGLQDEERGQAVDILIGSARGLGWFANLTDMIIDTLNELAGRPYVDRRRVLETVLSVLHYDARRFPDEMRAKWEELRDSLTGTDFSSLLERWVRMDLLVDKFDEEGNQVDQAQPWIEDLARQAVEHPECLGPELDWLTTDEAKNGYRFGYELGKLDDELGFLPAIVEKQGEPATNRSGYFLGGYLRVFFERDQGKWEELMDSLAEDERLATWVPELTWRVGAVSDRAALRILSLADDGQVDAGHFPMFVYGRITHGVSESVFQKWIKFLLSRADAFASQTALALYSHYYLSSESAHTPPDELTLKVLTNPPLLEESEAASRDQMSSYYWTQIGNAFVTLFPHRSLELADAMLDHFGARGSILGEFRSKTRDVLAAILRQHPEETWMRITDCLGPPIDERAYLLKDWLRGEDSWGSEKEGALSLVPPEAVWRWVDEDVDRRAWYLASFVPKLLFREEGRICWAREVLVRYGERDDVRRGLAANFSTEGWTGPESVHLETKKQALLDFLEEEEHANVIGWIKEYVSHIEKRIDRARTAEEREDF
jgi:hypothetical protein